MKYILLTLLFFCACKDTPEKPTRLKSAEAKPKPHNKNLVRFAGMNWMPYESITEASCLAELTREAFKRRGYKISLTEFPWARALEEVEEGHYDAMFCLLKTDERKRFMLYTDIPLCRTQHALCVLKDSKLTINSLEQARKYRLAVLRGASISPQFDIMDLPQKHIVGSESQVLQLLKVGRVELIAGEFNVFNHEIELHKLDMKIKTILPLQRLELFYGFSKKSARHKELKREFDLGLQQLIDDGTYEKIFKKYNLENASSIQR